VNGSNFVPSSSVRLNGVPYSTTLSQQQLSSISASAVSHPTTASVTVANPAPGGGTSNASSLSQCLNHGFANTLNFGDFGRLSCASAINWTFSFQ
jgi:hypothetical protein